MSDLSNAPADAGGATPAPVGGYDDDTAVAMLAELEREKRQPAAEPTEQPSDDGTDAAAPESDGEDAEASEPSEGDAAEEAAEPADDAEPEAEAEPELTEKIHGSTVTRLRDGTEVTIAELKRGYDELREHRAKLPDLTAAAEKAQEYAAREAHVAQQEQLFNTIVPLAFQRLQSQIPPPPDPALLDEGNPASDPIKYYIEDQKRQLAIAEVQELYSGLQAQYAQQQKQMEEARKAELDAFAEKTQQELRVKLPELADPEKEKAMYRQLVGTVSKYGFTEQEIDQGYKLYDSKMLYMLYDMSRKSDAYDKIAAQKPAPAAVKTKSAVPVQQPGRRISQQEAEQRSYAEQFKRWRENGYSDDGAVALLAMLEKGR